jgi:hypothetical protein
MDNGLGVKKERTIQSYIDEIYSLQQQIKSLKGALKQKNNENKIVKAHNVNLIQKVKNLRDKIKDENPSDIQKRFKRLKGLAFIILCCTEGIPYDRMSVRSILRKQTWEKYKIIRESDGEEYV